MTSQRARQVLAVLADGGPVTDDKGAAAVRLAETMGVGYGSVSNVLTRLDDLGYIERELHGKRTFAITITRGGRSHLAAQEGWSKRQREVRRTVEVCKAPPPMPVCGPIGHLDFDPVATRDACVLGLPA